MLSSLKRYLYASDSGQVPVVSTVPKRYDTWFIDDVQGKANNDTDGRSVVVIRASEGKYLTESLNLGDQPCHWTKVYTSHTLPQHMENSLGSSKEEVFFCAFFCGSKETKRNWLGVDEDRQLVLIPDKTGDIERELLGGPSPTTFDNITHNRLLWRLREFEPKWEYLQALLGVQLSKMHGVDLVEALRCLLSHSSDVAFAFLDVHSRFY